MVALSCLHGHLILVGLTQSYTRSPCYWKGINTTVLEDEALTVPGVFGQSNVTIRLLLTMTMSVTV